jgi:hypothetical protein
MAGETGNRNGKHDDQGEKQMTVLHQLTQMRVSRLRHARRVERETRPRVGIAVLTAVSDGLFGRRERMTAGLMEFPMAAARAAAYRTAA